MRIGIVGGGITGLSAAYYLSQKGHQISLFEKDSRLGGLAAGVEIDGGLVDKYYHHLFAGDRLVIDLIKEVGLGGRLVFKKPQTAIFYQGQIYPFTSALDLLRFTPLGLIDRLRFGVVGLYLKAIPDGKKYSTVAAQDWLRRFYGRKAYEVVWEPLLRSKFGRNISNISMAWFWSRVHDRTFSLGYLKGGFQLLIETLRKELKQKGACVNLGVSIVSIISHHGGVEIILEEGQNKHLVFDKVVVTTPLPEITFRSALSLILVLKKPFTNYYWLNVNDESFPFVAAVEQTNFVSAGGKTILYLGSYLDPADEKLQLSDEGLLDLYLPYLQKINPEFSRAWIEKQFVFKDSFAQPIVTTDYESKIPPFETPLKNVYLATMAQVYPQDRGMNQAVKLGKNVAEIIVA